MANATMKYVPAPGGRIITSKADAELVYREFQRLKRGNNNLRPESVLEAARPASSPLHKYFDWDDTSAAEAWRLAQARSMIREVHVIIQHEDKPEIRTRAIVSVVKSSGRSLEGIETAMGDEEYQQQLLTKALQELNIFRRKYAHLNALAGVLAEADRVLKQFATPDHRRRRRS